jgi:hypothetical protein
MEIIHSQLFTTAFLSAFAVPRKAVIGALP